MALKNGVFGAKKRVPDGYFETRQCQWCTQRTRMTDTSGTPWCEEHRLMLEIMNWGKEHNWPGIVVPPYALGEGEYLWRLALHVGTLAQAECIHAYIFSERDVIESGDALEILPRAEEEAS